MKNLMMPIRRGEEAQGIVEFGLIASILMLLFLGTIDYGRFMYYSTALASAARVGVEVSMNSCGNTTSCGASRSNFVNDEILQSAECDANSGGRVVLKPTISCSNCVLSSCLNNGPCTSSASPFATCSTTYCEQDVCLLRYGPSVACSTSASCGDQCSTGSLQSTTKSVTSGSTTFPGSNSLSGQCVVLTLGYNFVPISPLMRPFFPRTACWSNVTVPGLGTFTDSTPHTLCATARGRVF